MGTWKSLESKNLSIETYKELGTLPFFNAGLDNHTLEQNSSPVAVIELRAKVSQADALIISTSTSGMGANKAHESLRDLMDVISGRVVTGASFQVAKVNKKINAQGEIIDTKLVTDLQESLIELKRYLEKE